MRLPCSDLASLYSTPSGTTLAVVQGHQLLEQRLHAAGLKREALFFDDVETDDAQIAHVLLHQVGNVIVPHEQQVEWHVLAVTHQLVLAAAVLQAAADHQVERVVGEAPGLLQGDFETGSFVHHGRARPESVESFIRSAANV
jgi:hypothetical protein